MRIGITISPATGHLNAMTALARRLQQQGHDILCFGPPDARQRVISSGLKFEKLYEKFMPINGFAAKQRELSKLSGHAANGYIAEWYNYGCQAELEELPTFLQSRDFDGIVVDRVFPGTGIIAQTMKLPFVSVSCTPLIDLSGVTPPWSSIWPHEDNEIARQRNRRDVDNYLQRHSKMRATMLRYLESNGVTVDKQDMYWAESKLAYLTQIPQAFDFPGEHLPKHFHRTGPFQDSAGRESIPFPWEKLTGEPLIYASMGTIQNGLLDVFETIIAAVERPGYQLILSVGKNIAPESLMASRADTIIIQEAPQLELLEKATLCVNHAGANTVLEALAQGVPSVAIPITNDQPGVAARILNSGTGLFLPLEKVSATTLKAQVDKVLNEPSFRKRALEMKAALAKVDGPGMATRLIEKAFESLPRQ